MGWWSGLLSLAVLFIVLLVTTWGKFGDIFVDYGRSPYDAFLFANGRLPFRDFECLYGPFSVIVNGMAFRLWGISTTTLYALNAVLFAGMSVVLYWFFSRTFSLVASVAAAVTFIVAFGFSHTTKIGNYNYLAPYSSEALHGLYLGIIACVAGAWYVDRPSWVRNTVLSLVVALSLLTKIELAVAALAVWGTVYLILSKKTGNVILALKQFLLGTVVIFGLLAGVYLAASIFMTPREALSCVLGAWRMTFSPAARVPWNLETIGLDAPLANFVRLLWSFVSVAGVILLLAGGYHVVSKKAASSWLQFFVLPVALFFGWYACSDSSRIATAVYSLPLWIAGGWLWSMRKITVRGDMSSAYVVRSLWFAFALGCLARMLLNARVDQYGFVQAMPAVVGVIGCTIPRSVAVEDRRWKVGLLAFLIGAVLAFNVVQFKRSWSHLKEKTELIQLPRVKMLTYNAEHDPRVPIYLSALSWLQNRVSHERVLVIPEGQFMAFACGYIMPTRYSLLGTTEMAGFGESNILANLDEAAPDIVVVIHRYQRNFLFGQTIGYGKLIMEWLTRHYKREVLFGVEPHTCAPCFGVAVYSRLAEAADFRQDNGGEKNAKVE